MSPHSNGYILGNKTKRLFDVPKKRTKLPELGVVGEANLNTARK